MSAKKFKTYLQNQDPEYLIDELLTLYRTFEVVREFYTPRLEPSDTAKSVARKAISDFKKVNSNSIWR